MAESPKELASEAEAGKTRWGLIYSGVIAFTAVVISLLYLFSQVYSG